MYKLHKHQKYILNQFDKETKEALYNRFGFGISLIILEHLPDTAQRKRYRKVNKVIADHNYITLYWFFEFPQMYPYPHQFMIKRLAKHFVIQWFQILFELEQSVWIKESYLEMVEWLRYKRHVRFLVIHNSYLLLENSRFPIYYRHLNLFL